MQRELAREKILSFLGLATRAGKTISGSDAVMEALRTGAAVLTIVARDASLRTKKNILREADRAGVPCYFFSSRVLLGKFLGKEDRAVCAVTDEGFSKKLIQLLSEETAPDREPFPMKDKGEK